MQKFKIELILLFAVLVPLVAYAGQISGVGTIQRLNVPADGSFVRIDFSEPIVNPDGCGGADFYIRELDNTPGSQRFMAAVMSAFIAQKPVAFWIAGCTDKVHWGTTRPKVFDIYIESD